MFSLVYEGVGNEDVVGAPAALGKGPLEGVGYVGVFHKLHKVGVEDSSKEFAKATGDGYGAIICWVVFRAFFVEGGNIGFLP